jgi:hypothetical protein
MHDSNRQLMDQGIVPGEADRLAALQRYQMLDTPPEPRDLSTRDAAILTALAEEVLHA